MRKTLVIAVRDYLAAVKTKSFLISLALMPVLVIGGMLLGRWSRSVVDTTPKRVAVIDHSADENSSARPPLFEVIQQAAEERNEEIRKPNGELEDAPYYFERVVPEADSPEALNRLRLELSDRVRNDELFGFIEIGPRIIETPSEEMQSEFGLLSGLGALGGEEGEAEAEGADPFGGGLTEEQAALIDQFGIRFSSKNEANQDVQGWLTKTLTPIIYQRRFLASGIPPQSALQLIVPPQVAQRPLAVRETGGEIGYEPAGSLAASLMIPFFSVFLLFSLVAMAAFPLTTNIIEEKQLRIAEVLLGSVRPFELMLGKLLGGVAISLTLAVIYGAGLFYVATQYDLLDYVGVDVLVWFVIFATLATLMVGAMSVAAGAAVTNLKEAQNIQTPIVLLPMLPALVALNVARDPQGPLAQAFTWFPLTTPITSVMRITIRDGMPFTDRVLAALLSVVTTLVLVWLAGRIFRHGMLRSEKAAAFSDMLRWVTRG